MTRASPLLALLLVAGCGATTRPCKSDTLYLTIQLDTTTATADTLEVDVTLGAGTKRGTLPHKIDAFSGSVQVDFAGTYPANQTATVSVLALAHGSALGASAQRVILGTVCSALSFSIGGGDVVDLGVNDFAVAGDGFAALDGAPLDAGSPLAALCLPGTCAAGLLCVDGVCCDSACSGNCEACDIAGSVGHCAAVTGTPHGNRPLCTGAGKTCGGSCNGTLQTDCTYPAASVNCVPANCTAGIKTPPVNCDGAGSCPSPVALTCLTPACNGVNCAVNCTSDGDCSSGATPFCDHGACTAHFPTGRSCTAGTDCNSGNCANSVCCDQPCTGACQVCNFAGTINGTAITPGTCTATSGTVCRPAAGPCDVAESCTGSSADCPPDTFAPASMVCRGAVDVCDATETCTGTTATCPPDGYLSSAAVCRASTGACDPAEHCTGSTVSCPPNSLAAGGTVCAIATDCLNAAVCSGSSASCPAPTDKPNGTACNSSSQDCCTGGAETCTNGVCKTSGCCNTTTCCRE